MSMLDWAKNEVKLACNKENPDWDGESFDYGCSCYMSALKAYETLCADGHSGLSFSVTRNILIRLMKSLPLTSITEKDFTGSNCPPNCLSAGIQCDRMYSLFKHTGKNGEIYYSDIDRACSVNCEMPDNVYGMSLATRIVDEMFPITMPYYPSTEKYRVYIQEFIHDASSNDMDTWGVLYIRRPNGEKTPVNRYYAEYGNQLKEITKEEYDKRLARRVDPVGEKTADRIMDSIISCDKTDKETYAREDANCRIPKEYKDDFYGRLRKLCDEFGKEENWCYNTWDTVSSICRGKCGKELPEFILDIQKLAEEYEGMLEQYSDKAENKKD